MSNTLKVIKPFGSLSAGDILELNKDSNNYEYSHRDKFAKIGKNGENYDSSVSFTVEISPAFAKALIDEGCLKSIDADKQEFVNVFDEIDRLLNVYTEELKAVDKTMHDCPECVKLERTTVLNNLITLLTYLKKLKK